MKKFWLLILLLSIAGFSRAQDLLVTVKKVSDQPGSLMVGLFNTSKSFLKEPFRGEKVAAHEGTVSVVFKNVQPGEYAISVFHDVNGDGKLDVNFIGMPREGIGASNDASGTFGPPSYEKAKFTSPRSDPVSVTMKYY